MFRVLQRMRRCSCGISDNTFTIKRYTSNSRQNSKKRIVLLGTGWGSYSVLKNIDKKLFDVTVVSPRNHFLFTPLLNSTTVGTLEFRSIIESIHQKNQKDIDFHLAKAVEIDTKNNTLTCQPEFQKFTYKIKYDKIVIGVGAKSNSFGVPGVEEHAFFLKEIRHARAVRDKLISNLEMSVLPNTDKETRLKFLHFVIVGGGPTGVEFGAELYDFITEDVARLFPQIKEDVHVSLIEGQTILPSFDQRLRKFVEKRFHQRKNYHLVKDFVVEVGKDFVALKSGDIIKTGLIVWSTGLSPRSFINNCDLPKSKSGQVIVDENLLVKGCENVYAIGDCSSVENRPYPCTAQIAERQGRYLAKELNKQLKGELSEPFTWFNMGMMAYVGGHDAVADLPTKAGKLSGFATWLLWRSVYLTRLGSWRNRLQVPFDWTRQLVFGRDTSRF